MADADQLPVVDYSRTSQSMFDQNNQMEFDVPRNDQADPGDSGDTSTLAAENYAKDSDSVFDNPRSIIPGTEVSNSLGNQCKVEHVDYQRESEPVFQSSRTVQSVVTTSDNNSELDSRLNDSIYEYARQQALAMYGTDMNSSVPVSDSGSSQQVNDCRNQQLYVGNDEGRVADLGDQEHSAESVEYQGNAQTEFSGIAQPGVGNTTDQVDDYARNNTGNSESAGVPVVTSGTEHSIVENTLPTVIDTKPIIVDSFSLQSHRANARGCRGNSQPDLGNIQTVIIKTGQTSEMSSHMHLVKVENIQSDEYNAGVEKMDISSDENVPLSVRNTKTEQPCASNMVADVITNEEEPVEEADPVTIEERSRPLRKRRKTRSGRYPRRAAKQVSSANPEVDDADETEQDEMSGETSILAQALAQGKHAEESGEKEQDGEKESDGVPDAEAENQQLADGNGKKSKGKGGNTLPPLPNGRKKHSIPLWRKMEILNEFDKKPAGMSRRKLVGQLGLKNRSTLSSILGSREKIMQEFSNSTSEKQRERRRMRSLKYDDIEEVITKWMEQCKVNKLPINGIVIQKKAERLAKKLGHVQFKASNGWLDRFKARNAVNLKEFSGKLADMSSAVDEPVYEWKELCLPVLIREYDASDIFVCSGGGLAFGLLPSEIAGARGGQCLNGENSKERITFCPCVNMDGSEKEALILIGNFTQNSTYSYGGILNTGAVHTEMNDNSWVTPDSFYNYMLSLDSKMQLDERHIILFTDDRYAKLEEKKSKELKNVSLKTIPGHFNPANRGISKAIKSEYRYCQMKKILEALGDDMKGKMPTITVQDAAKMLETAWKELSPSTISASFLEAGFDKKIEEVNENDNATSSLEVGTSEKAKEKTPCSPVHLFKKLKQYYKLPESLLFEDYLNADDALATCDERTPETPVEDILPTVDIMMPENLPEQERAEPSRNTAPPPESLTPQDAVSAIGKVRRFLQMHNTWGNVPPAFFFSLDTMEQYVIDERMRSTFSGHLPTASSLTASVANAANPSNMSNMPQSVNMVGAGSPPPNAPTPATPHMPQLNMGQNQGQGMGPMGHMPNNTGHNTPIPPNTGHTHMSGNFGHFPGNMGHHHFVGNVPLGHIPGNPSSHITGNSGQWTAVYQNPNNYSPN